MIYLYSGGCMDRTILHVDMNAYYASVECFYHPELRDKPVAVSGDVEQRHGIILAKNQIAKKFGIATGEAIWQARQKCHALVTVPAHYDLYM
jgi:DNA polymerase IV